MSRRKLDAACRRLGATVRVIPGNLSWHDVIAQAPDGKVWSASGTHELSDMGCPGKGAVDAICARVLADVLQGLSDCTDPDCEICHGQ